MTMVPISCPCLTCDLTEDIKGLKIVNKPLNSLEGTPKYPPQTTPAAKMRFVVPLVVFLAVAAFHSVLSASLESAEKEEKLAEHDGLTELKKIDQMEFEAAQKEKATQMNVTEEQNEDSHYEAAQDGSVEEHVEAESDKTGAGKSPDATAQEESESESSEERDGRQRRDDQVVVTEVVSSLDEASQDSPKQQDVLE